MRLLRRYPAPVFFLLALLVLDIVSRTRVSQLAFHSDYRTMRSLTNHVQAQPVPPRAIFLGSSHTQTAVAATRIEQRLDLPAGAVVNLGTSGGRPAEMLYLYRENRNVLRQAQVAFLGIEGWMFDRDFAADHAEAYWRRTAGLKERLSRPAPLATKADLVVGWASGLWDQRTSWLSLVTNAVKGPMSPSDLFDEWGRPFKQPERVVMNTTWLAQDATTVAGPAEQRPYHFWPEAMQPLTDLVQLLQADGVRVVFVYYPVSPPLHGALQASFATLEHPWRAEQHRRWPDLPWLEFDDFIASAPPSYFRDSDHLSTQGALAFSERLSHALQPYVAP